MPRFTQTVLAGCWDCTNDPKQEAQKQEQIHHQLQGYWKVKIATWATKGEDHKDRKNSEDLGPAQTAVGRGVPLVRISGRAFSLPLGSLNHFLWEVLNKRPSPLQPWTNLGCWSAARCLPRRLLLFCTWIPTPVALVRSTPLHRTWEDFIEKLSHPPLCPLQTPLYVHQCNRLEVLDRSGVRDLGVVGFRLEKGPRVWGSTPSLVSMRAPLILLVGCVSSCKQILRSKTWKTTLETEKNTKKSGSESQITRQPRDGGAMEGRKWLCLLIYCVFHPFIYSGRTQSYFPAFLAGVAQNRTYKPRAVRVSTFCGQHSK